MCERCGESDCWTVHRRTVGRQHNFCCEDYPVATDRTTAQGRRERDDMSHADIGGEG